MSFKLQFDLAEAKKYLEQLIYLTTLTQMQTLAWFGFATGVVIG